jgi:hypothetical protein
MSDFLVGFLIGGILTGVLPMLIIADLSREPERPRDRLPVYPGYSHDDGSLYGEAELPADRKPVLMLVKKKKQGE